MWSVFQTYSIIAPEKSVLSYNKRLGNSLPFYWSAYDKTCSMQYCCSRIENKLKWNVQLDPGFHLKYIFFCQRIKHECQESVVIPELYIPNQRLLRQVLMHEPSGNVKILWTSLSRSRTKVILKRVIIRVTNRCPWRTENRLFQL